MRNRAAAILAATAYFTAMGAPAQAADASEASGIKSVRLDTPSGYPVPRFVSLKDEETNCRVGPSFDHPVRFVFKRAGAPVLVVAESVDHWRKLRDFEGDECWAHRTTLKAQTHVLIENSVELMRRPSIGSGVSARMGTGVMARIVKRKGDWLLVSAENAKGWVEADAVWGGDPTGAHSAGRN